MDGVPGMMTITKYTNGSVCWNQSILRDFPNVSYAGANNTEPLTNGNFLMTVYALRDDGSFDRGYPIKENISITSIVAKRDNGPNHTSGRFSSESITQYSNIIPYCSLVDHHHHHHWTCCSNICYNYNNNHYTKKKWV